MEKYPNHIVDINFDFVKNHIVTDKEIEAILDIQRDVKSPFLSVIEPSKEQSLDDFIAQLENMDNPYNQRICPTVDLDTKTPGLFVQKLNYVKENYKRFNVKYSSLYTRYTNWLDLSEGIFGQDIWCNVTSVPRGVFNGFPPYRSLLACTFLYGVHTASHGYGRRPTVNYEKKIESKRPSEYPKRLLDPNTFYYNSSSLSYDECIVRSINNITSEMKKMRQHIIDETFLTKYLPRRDGLLDELYDLQGRV